VIVSIDSSVGTSVAAVRSDATVLAEAQSDNPRGHAEVVGALLESVLREAGESPLEAVVMGVGPGPFTGLRVGMAAAMALAWGREVPLLPIVSMDAACYGREGRVLVWSDQKRRERAWALYDVDGGIPRSLLTPTLHPVEGFEAVIAAHPEAEVVEVSSVNAAHLATIALAYRARGDGLVAPMALYLRPPDVTLA
jgi:tRNA threonylcarbamoyladenosine biosynthesis protein TsaB